MTAVAAVISAASPDPVGQARQTSRAEVPDAAPAEKKKGKISSEDQGGDNKVEVDQGGGKPSAQGPIRTRRRGCSIADPSPIPSSDTYRQTELLLSASSSQAVVPVCRSLHGANRQRGARAAPPPNVRMTPTSTCAWPARRCHAGRGIGAEAAGGAPRTPRLTALLRHLGRPRTCWACWVCRVHGRRRNGVSLVELDQDPIMIPRPAHVSAVSRPRKQLPRPDESDPHRVAPCQASPASKPSIHTYMHAAACPVLHALGAEPLQQAWQRVPCGESAPDLVPRRRAVRLRPLRSPDDDLIEAAAGRCSQASR
ncbi:hypothetical protein CDD83_4905 [Cordyceps sp. RAO-2017]|nr:hypothetical protein CDD83_4905 [Cordyceps sp. RAO-2017]